MRTTDFAVLLLIAGSAAPPPLTPSATMPTPLRPTQDTTPPRVHAVASVDLTRYAGRWHEVARFPNRFQQACARETTADYALLDDGAIRVTNRCLRADGSALEAVGRARLADAKGPASRLKVRFAPAWLSFLPMVWGDYWILDLDDDYSIALVGDPGRKYLWILARSPTPPDSLYQRMVATAAAQGFDVSKLVRSP